MTMKTEHRQNASKDWIILAVIFAVVVVTWYSAWHLIDKYVVTQENTIPVNEQLRGAFGDKFGAINALFSGLAFAGIIFTVLLQTREINHTKQAFEQQVQTSSSQRFDSIFFQMLALHNDITAKLVDLHNNGRQSFKSFHERLIQSDEEFSAFCALQKLEVEEIRLIRDARNIPATLRQKLDNSDVANIETALTKGAMVCDNFLDTTSGMQERRIRAAYVAAATKHIDNYSHYFRNLYHILKFISETNLINDIEKARYAKIVRSQLSEIELVSLFYNSLTEVKLPGRENMELGYPKMGKLLVKYDILQNMSPRSVVHPSHLTIFNANNRA